MLAAGGGWAHHGTGYPPAGDCRILSSGSAAGHTPGTRCRRIALAKCRLAAPVGIKFMVTLKLIHAFNDDRKRKVRFEAVASPKVYKTSPLIHSAACATRAYAGRCECRV